LRLGASHNRYAVADQVRDFLWDLTGTSRAREVAKVITREPSANWYDHPLLYRRPLHERVAKAFASLGALATEEEDDEMVEIGERVEHAAFGEGEVIDLEAGGIVLVEFDSGERRKLMWSYAPMRKLS
jgi:hypothetical protein